MGFSLLRALEFFVIRKMECPKLKSTCYAGGDKLLYKKSPFRYNKAEQPQQENTVTIKESIARQIKTESKSVSVEMKHLETKRPPQPKPSILAEKYPHLKEIDHKLKDQNKAIFEREKKCDKLKKELSECTVTRHFIVDGKSILFSTV